jgi:hypothetical protein
MISSAEFVQGWDSERRVHELNRLQTTVKGTTLYIPAKTKSDFDLVYGSRVTHVKYRTFESEFKVWLTPCRPDDPDARPLVLLTDTQSAAQLAFAIPLRKLGIQKVPDTRQYTFTLERIPVEGGGMIYEMSFRDFDDLPRQIDEETAAAIKKIKAEQAKANRERKRAERIGKLTGGGNGNSGTTNA